MKYVSTRNSGASVSSAEAITAGISPDGGLFVPETTPRFSLKEIIELSKLDYIGRTKAILSPFLTDFTEEEIDSCVTGAYESGFSSEKIAPLEKLGDGEYILELFRGPTCAFKDMALQILPRLLTAAAAKTAPGREIVVLTATSGDTGKAALEGFRDVPNVRIIVFYPNDGVSPMQKLQMQTQEGSNVAVCGVEGNFDDAQRGVKRMFTDPAIKKRLEENSMIFSSANSINWGRLVPQTAYYFSAYCDLLSSGEIKAGDGINFAVPTGNFGNILAAYYAKSAGLPINRLICASNRNRVLADFLATGVYDRNRKFYTTISPSMDILVSSNLERLLYSVAGDAKTREWTNDLENVGKYEVDAETLREIKKTFAGGSCDDESAKAEIAAIFGRKNYLCDPHTAVAAKALRDYAEQTGDSAPTVITATASPFKFAASVLEAIEGGAKRSDEFESVERLAAITGKSCPERLSNLRGKPVRFDARRPKEEMAEFTLETLGI